jgi:cold shock CspA family protein
VKQTGKVVAVVEHRGYFFISRPDAPDLFAHASSLAEGWPVAVGDEIEFEVAEDPRVAGRSRAANCRRVNGVAAFWGREEQGQE